MKWRFILIWILHSLGRFILMTPVAPWKPKRTDGRTTTTTTDGRRTKRRTDGRRRTTTTTTDGFSISAVYPSKSGRTKTLFFLPESSRWDLSSQMVSKPLEALFERVFKVLWHFQKKIMKICMRPWIGRLCFWLNSLLGNWKIQKETNMKKHCILYYIYCYFILYLILYLLLYYIIYYKIKYNIQYNIQLN